MTYTAGEVVDGLFRAMHQVRRASMDTLAPLGVTPAQGRALRTIARAGDDGMRMGELAEQLGVVPRSATSLVDALESAGLVERVADPRSRRAVIARLAGDGRRVLADLVAARTAAGERLLSGLTAAERETLGGLLSKITDAGDPAVG
jgi:DNA-binding MarR family transcriptional regulator